MQWTTFKYVDLARGRSAVHPDALNTLLTALLIEDIEVGNLDKRILQLKQEQAN